MSDLMAPVKDGKVEQYDSEVTKKRQRRGTTELGKDSFLELLVAQMRYQDPLQPSSDTEWISQLASFSSLEQMQSLNETVANSQAFSLVGKNVSVKLNADSSKTVEGIVDFITMKNGKAYLSINGEKYESSLLLGITDSYYIAKQKAPTVEKTDATYNHQEPKDVKVKVDMGTDTGMAGSVYVVLNGEPIKSEYLTYDESKGVLTIDEAAFKRLDAGKYDIGFVFDDVLKTVVSGQVTVKVEGEKPEIEDVLPSVEEMKATYNHDDPEDIMIKMDLGEGEGLADNVVVILNGQSIPSKYCSYDTEKEALVIQKEAFASMDTGEYNMGFVFNDSANTVIDGKVKVNIKGTKPLVIT